MSKNKTNDPAHENQSAKNAPTDPNATPMPLHFAAGSGFLMGGADAIPGVSGGTIALIIGIYERFIGSLSIVIKSPVLLRTADGRALIGRALRFLVPLGIGLVVAYYLATKLLVGKETDPGLMRRVGTAPACYAFFFGVVLASIPQPWRRIKGGFAPQYLIAAALGCAAAVIFVGLPYQNEEPAKWMLLWGGAGAIAVMLLPGVSGSLFLVIVGQYQLVAGAAHDRDVATLGIFAVGIVLGAITFVPLLRLLLDKRHNVTMAVLTGLMAGSLRALWPWKSSYDPKAAPMDNVGVFGSLLWVFVGLVLGIVVVFLLTRLEKRLAPSHESSSSEET